MGSSDFFKGDKKKKKGSTQSKNVSFGAPTFTLPEIVSKKKKYSE